MTTPTSSLSCSPAWATPPTPGRPTDALAVGRVAAALGRPLIPWQVDLAAVTGERRPDGRLAYRIVVVIVPRRAGKTLLLLAVALTRLASRPLSRAFHLMHRRETAAAMWRDDWFTILEHSPFARRLDLRRANGSEAISWRGRGSTLRLMPPDGGAARSFASDLVLIDEGREFSIDQGADFEAGIWPTQATTDGQIWIVSNAGTPASGWLAKYRDLGREAVAEGRDLGLCYLEYALPDGLDPDDPANWFAAHPGLGHHVHLEVLEQDHELMDRDSFATEYLGLWPATAGDTHLQARWAATLDPDAAPANPVVFAVETTIDRDRSWIVAAGLDAAGRVVVELLEDRPHGAWLAPRLTELVAAHDAAAVVWDQGGPVAGVAPDFDFATDEVPLNTREVAAAAGRLVDAVSGDRFAHRADPAWDAAVIAAARRPAGGAWVWDRRHPLVGPIVAASLAAWVLADTTRGRPTVT